MSTRKEDTRYRLFEAARKLLLKRGFHGVGLEDIAEAAGVSRQAVYKSHFASKADLLLELVRHVHVAENLDELRALNLRPEDLERKGRHPDFGPVTLSQLLATWAAHDLTHLHQISRTMAHRYRETVGPWTVFLGVMQCTGHSS